MNWLEEASQITRQDREKAYGAPLINFLRIALFWSAYLGRLITPLDVAWLMTFVKAGREMQTFKVDNYVDTMGYMDCVYRMDVQLKEMGYVEGVLWFRTATFTTQDMERLLQRLKS